jgi:hypothetical protein
MIDRNGDPHVSANLDHTRMTIAALPSYTEIT